MFQIALFNTSFDDEETVLICGQGRQFDLEGEVPFGSLDCPASLRISADEAGGAAFVRNRCESPCISASAGCWTNLMAFCAVHDLDFDIPFRFLLSIGGIH